MAKTPHAQLESFIAKFSPQVAAVTRAGFAAMRRRLPGATVMVYDNYNALVVGFGPTERPSEAILSLAVYPRSVALCFLRGASLPDPRRLLMGSGKVARHVVLGSAADLDKPAIRALIAQAVRLAALPMPTGGRGPIIIRSISAKQRPRRPR